jgi:prefoldin alpha subunit
MLNPSAGTLTPHGQTRQEAISLYTSKVKFVQENLDKLQATIERKQDNLQSCVGILQMKMQEERQQGGVSA